MLQPTEMFAILLSATVFLRISEAQGSFLTSGGLSIRDQPSITTITLGGPASTTLYGGVETFIYYSATAPARPQITPATSISYGGIPTPVVRTNIWTGISSSLTDYFTDTGYYTVLRGSTYYVNQPVPLSIWAPQSYPCPDGFANLGGTCAFCPAGFWTYTVEGDPRMRAGCQVMTVYTPPCDGYFATNTAGASSCVSTATTTSKSCAAGWSTYSKDGSCVSGTNVEGWPGPSPPALGGPATTATIDGIAVTEYSAILLSAPNVVVYSYTLYGSPTTTFTIGGGTTTAAYTTCTNTGLCQIGRDYFTTSTTESLGIMTVTEYQSVVVPYGDADLASSSTSGGAFFGSVMSSSAVTAGSVSTTASSASTAAASSPSTASASTPRNGEAGYVSIDLAALSMAAVLALGALVAL